MKLSTLLLSIVTLFLPLSQASAEKTLVLDMDAAHLSRYDADDDNSLRQVVGAAELVGLDMTLEDYIVAALEAARDLPATIREQRLAGLEDRVLAIRLKSGEKLSAILAEEVIHQRRVTEQVYRKDSDSDGPFVAVDPADVHLARCTSRGCTPRPDACTDASDWQPYVSHTLDTLIFFSIIDVAGFGYAYEGCNEDIEFRTRPRYVSNLALKVGPDISIFRNDGVCHYDNNDFDQTFLATGSTIQARFFAINFDTHSILSGSGLSDLSFDGYAHHICED